MPNSPVRFCQHQGICSKEWAPSTARLGSVDFNRTMGAKGTALWPAALLFWLCLQQLGRWYRTAFRCFREGSFIRERIPIKLTRLKACKCGLFQFLSTTFRA